MYIYKIFFFNIIWWFNGGWQRVHKRRVTQTKIKMGHVNFTERQDSRVFYNSWPAKYCLSTRDACYKIRTWNGIKPPFVTLSIERPARWIVISFLIAIRIITICEQTSLAWLELNFVVVFVFFFKIPNVWLGRKSWDFPTFMKVERAESRRINKTNKIQYWKCASLHHSKARRPDTI